jgi:uncharacterized protein with von Willebrand factor type A (vWA) domain
MQKGKERAELLLDILETLSRLEETVSQTRRQVEKVIGLGGISDLDLVTIVKDRYSTVSQVAVELLEDKIKRWGLRALADAAGDRDLWRVHESVVEALKEKAGENGANETIIETIEEALKNILGESHLKSTQRRAREVLEALKKAQQKEE